MITLDRYNRATSYFIAGGILIDFVSLDSKFRDNKDEIFNWLYERNISDYRNEPNEVKVEFTLTFGFNLEDRFYD